MNSWFIIVISLSVALLVFLIWKELRRSNKARRNFRLLATTLAVASFACIALPVKYRQNSAVNNATNVILLTEGFNTDSIKSYLNQDRTNVYTVDDNLLAARKQNATLLSDIGSINNYQEAFNAIHVFGYGLEQEDLDRLKDQPIVFHPSKLPTGITSVDWNRNLKSGDKLYVQGSFNNNTSSPLKLILKDFSVTLDSITIAANKLQQFELTTIPKHAGRALYNLVVLKGNDTLANEPVPIQVHQGEPLKILILSSSPDFENKFLKNWITDKGYQVVSRSLITKNKFDKDFQNTNTYNIDRITPTLLSNFNIIISDASELASISKSELGAIQNAVFSKSTGIIVRSDYTSSSLFYSIRFPVTTIGNNEQKQLAFHLVDTSTKLGSLTIDNAAFIRVQDGTQPIVFDKHNRVFVNSVLYGSGKIIYTTLNNTYSWMLSGNKSDYENYWSEILNKAAGKKIAEESWSISPFFPKVDKAANIHVETNQADLPQAQVANTTIYLINNPDFPFSWSGMYWPVKAGWQPSIQLNGNTFWWYAFDKNDWRTIDANERLRNTILHETAHNSNTTSILKATENIEVEFPKIYFFLIFLFSCAYLWYENKIL